ncbi:MAG: tetratricopeptide repeat protein [Saprospiraceae bacterium]
MKRFNTLLSFWVFIFLISSCATQKSKEDPSKVGKFYHDVTSKYNGYFNANELLEASIVSLNEQHQDNYNKILSVYKYSAADNATVVAGDLDNAIKKVSIVASLHPASHWKDDCYLLMGQSQYVKKDYESAEETLEFMVDEYDPKNAGKKRKKGKKKKKSKKQKKKEAKEKKKKREQTQKEKKKAQDKKRKEKENARKKRIKESKKKAKQNKKNRKKGKKSTPKKKTEKKEPEVKVVEPAPEVKEEKKEEKKEKDESGNYFLKHKPAFQEGVLWLARTYIERDKFDQASRLIDRLKNDPKTFKEIKRDLAPVEADFYLKQKKYAQAIAPLERAIGLTKNKTDKARYAYIVAQLHQKLGQGEAAYAYFGKAKKYSRDYEMRFSSQLNMETNAWLNGKATADETITRLNKMLKNDKNEEYQDQIHYALAGIYLKTNQSKEAIANLQLSLNKSETNPAQKAESYLLLAQLFFQDENYVSSKNYYDSTLLVMGKTDDRYMEAQKYATSLTEIAANIQIIELQDSLLRISSLSDDEKRKIAAKLKKEEQEALASQSKASKPSNKIGGNRPNLRPGNRPTQFQEASTWVFYDEKKVKKGKRSFEKKWGNRKMEDDWRRSNRRGASQADDEIIEDVVEEGSDLGDDEIAKILSDVPKTPEEIAEVKGKIKDALYELGTLYRDRLENNEKAVETLGKLENRFPGNNHELNAWYYQYLSYTDLTQQPTAKIYKDKINGKYPESTYAKVLNGNAVAFENEEQKLKNYYKDTYSDFVNLDYKTAYEKVGRVKEIFGEKNPLQPKFALLSSMCIGNLKGKGEYVKSLKEVVAQFPDTPEQSRAKEILRLLGELKEDPAIPKEGGAKGKFKLQDNKVHYMIVVLKGGKIELGDAKIKVSNYNREYHKSDKLRISNIYLGADTNTPILVIRRFKNKDKSIAYFQGIMANKKKFLGDNNDYEVFAVTQHNYREILKSKSIEDYREFFKENYK